MDDEERDDVGEVGDDAPVQKYTWKFRQTQLKTHWFDCSHVGCKVRLQLIQDPPTKEKGTWAIYNSDGQHDHSREQIIKERGLSARVKELVTEWEQQLIKPKRMIGLLQERNITPPPIKQINTFLLTVRKHKRKKATGSAETEWSLSDMKTFAEQNSVKPDQVACIR